MIDECKCNENHAGYFRKPSERILCHKGPVFHGNWAIPVHLLQEMLAEAFKTITGVAMDTSARRMKSGICFQAVR